MVAKLPTAGRQISCEKCPLRAMAHFREFLPEELDFVRQFKAGELNAETGATVLAEGSRAGHLYTLLSGLAFRFKTLPDGRRQILNYVFPGDFLGLQSSLLDEMQHSVELLTDSVLCFFPRDKLWNLFNNFPSLAFDITWLAAREEQNLGEQIVNIGRRSALERMAYLLLYLYERSEPFGFAKGNKLQFPFTQQHIADTLGMSLVHANKTIRRLAVMRLARWQDRTFEILNRGKLEEVALFPTLDKATARPFI